MKCQIIVGEAIIVSCFGKIQRMVAAGRGKYPYDCTHKEKYPDSMIFYSEDLGAWIPEEDLAPTGPYNYNKEQNEDGSPENLFCGRCDTPHSGECPDYL